MLKQWFIVVMIVLSAVSISFADSGPDMQEGLWQITTTVSMQGMSMPPTTHTQCITKGDLVPRSSQPGQECKITDVRIVGNTVMWNIECSGQGNEMKGSGTITYEGDSLEGTMKMIMRETGVEITSQISGHRIGDCK